MKNLILLVFFLGFSFSITAQNMDSNEAFVVKKNKIYQGDTDVTETLTKEKRESIFASYKAEMKLQEEKEQAEEEKTKQEKEFKKTQDEKDKEIKKAQKEKDKREKELKKNEKEVKKAEKKQKQAEKALKKKEKAQAGFEKAKSKLDSSQKKYERLKEKGKLSPQEEAKWLKKLEGLNNDIKKAEKKLRKA